MSYAVASPNGIFVYDSKPLVNVIGFDDEDVEPHDDPVPASTATRFEIVEGPNEILPR